MSDIWKDLEWMSPKVAAEYLGVEPKVVRAWIKDGSLLAVPSPEDGKQAVPKDFLVKQEDYAGPLETLRGTVTLLRDCGFSDQEAVTWLFTVEDSLGQTPLAALLSGKKKAVRRVAGALAL
ncbi:MAG: Rv2175c family DNA-binding protein [Mobiluncus porci]|uniref:Transcriptional regulator n=1 Tax=Mobiluncus porci TaxID=2652278 RepID=A0A7K0K190_9ACTO|nr:MULTISPECIES: Rv2175c family DNA-binding protein [Mobiluncus]MCI6585328.1 Rv2175c family DNA-binding protein [Mobiluncus sp.]MDD7541463.1 Rv2175c family DNA-binding protein [Mobiluncus porci]MDY5748448.1 Rv2175c family DNA-binding protein [Mobiluncus porci]MST48795.1 transcriptional regulator [Mobiluncus porci]